MRGWEVLNPPDPAKPSPAGPYEQVFEGAPPPLYA